jgi:HD-GYP domain-containing protein (c-di-GMP phosphodiesterase class II)
MSEAPFDPAAPDTSDVMPMEVVAAETATALDGAGLQEELDAVLWLQQEVREERPLPLAEAEAATASLYVAMRADGPTRLPQIPLNGMSDYTAVHAINVTVIAMGLAEATQLDPESVRKVGLVALLHDIGMTRIPVDIMAKRGQISPAERERIKEHPEAGARIILAADARLDLAAVVAYEHHILMDGSGYPKLRFPRPTHYVSRLVQICDVYHALRSPRPFRDPWPINIVFSFLNERAGFEFHPALASALTSMIERMNSPEAHR